MIRWLVWCGVALASIGAIVFVAFVFPRIAPASSPPIGQLSFVTTTLAVVVSAVGLAAGCVSIGIGLGKWRHPSRSADGSREV